jgi:hypothetical protein
MGPTEPCLCLWWTWLNPACIFGGPDWILLVYLVAWLNPGCIFGGPEWTLSVHLVDLIEPCLWVWRTRLNLACVFFGRNWLDATCVFSESNWTLPVYLVTWLALPVYLGGPAEPCLCIWWTWLDPAHVLRGTWLNLSCVFGGPDWTRLYIRSSDGTDGAVWS